MGSPGWAEVAVKRLEVAVAKNGMEEMGTFADETDPAWLVRAHAGVSHRERTAPFAATRERASAASAANGSAARDQSFATAA